MAAKKIRLMSFFLILSFGGIIIRLAWWQIGQHEKLITQAQRQYQEENIIPARRGEILYDDGFPLATNESRFNLYIFKPEVEKDFSQLAYQLAQFTPEGKTPTVEEERIKELLTSKLLWLPIWNNLPKGKAEKISQKYEGIRIQEIPKRVYPEEKNAAHLIGFVGKDTAGNNQGYFGLEGHYNKELEGQPGRLLQEEDALGQPIILGENQTIPAQPGQDIKLFLKRDLQYLVEKKLAAGVEKYGAQRGIVIVSNPQNGAILAMASQPSFDPNNYSEFEQEDFVNPAISLTFEPGSVFKPLVMAAALDAGVVKPQTKCSYCHRPKKIGDYEIRTWNNEYHPQITMNEIIQYSDNVGMVFVGESLGKENLLKYLKNYGFGQKTNIGLQGEASGLLKPISQWYPVDAATATFGQGIAVTPVQMIQALNTLANGGKLIPPRVVAAINKNDEWEKQPQKEERIISQKASQQIKAMMVNAVESGEAKWTKIPNTQIAGKTGTAQIPIEGHYDPNKTIASFVGFAPADNPRFSMIVTLFEPSSSVWASETAAPLWFDIAQNIFLLESINPRRNF